MLDQAGMPGWMDSPELKLRFEQKNNCHMQTQQEQKAQGKTFVHRNPERSPHLLKVEQQQIALEGQSQKISFGRCPSVVAPLLVSDCPGKGGAAVLALLTIIGQPFPVAQMPVGLQEDPDDPEITEKKQAHPHHS